MHAYLIIAHEQFDLLESLLKCIDDARNDIYIHIDSRSELDIGRIEKVLRNSRVEFVPRIHIRWGGFDMVRCEYMLLEAAFESGREYEYVHLISGADLPLKNQDEIHRYFPIPSRSWFPYQTSGLQIPVKYCRHPSFWIHPCLSWS